MKFIDRLVYLLIQYDEGAPWWRRLNTRVNEGAIIGLMLFLWSNIFFLLGALLFAKSAGDTFKVVLYAWVVMLVVSGLLSVVLGIRQNRDRIQDVPIAIPDKTLNRILAVYIIVPFAAVIIGLFVAFAIMLRGTALNPDLISLKKQAKAGDRVAQYQLGSRYLEGKGVKQDYKKAFTWFQKSAEQGLAPALLNMGESYFYGVGVDKDEAKAITFYKRAAEHNSSRAELILGYIYGEEKYGRHDGQQSMYWFERAAKHDVVQAAHQLGVIYYLGKFTEQNDSLALVWFRKAAYHGEANSQYMLGLAYRDGVLMHRDLNLSTQWVRKAALQGHPAAMRVLAECYQNGIGVEKNYARARWWYEEALNREEQSSRTKLLSLESIKALPSGQAIQLTYPQANNFKEESYALYKKGFGLLFGVEGETDYSKAIYNLTEAAEKGSPNAKVLLAYCYATGFGAHLNTEVAVHLYVGKGQVKYDIGDESYTIDFEIFEDGTFTKTMGVAKSQNSDSQ